MENSAPLTTAAHSPPAMAACTSGSKLSGDRCGFDGAARRRLQRRRLERAFALDGYDGVRCWVSASSAMLVTPAGDILRCISSAMILPCSLWESQQRTYCFVPGSSSRCTQYSVVAGTKSLFSWQMLQYVSNIFTLPLLSPYVFVCIDEVIPVSAMSLNRSKPGLRAPCLAWKNGNHGTCNRTFAGRCSNSRCISCAGTPR